MKKLKAIVVAACFLFAGTVASAQTKIAYISVDQVVGLMPATARIDSLVQQYGADSIQPEYARLITQYQWKDSVYRDSLHTPKSVRDQIAKELPSFIYQIQNWQQIAQQASEAKQNELLAPIYKEVYDAIKAVAKEKGYSHVFARESLIVMPDGDNIFTLVAAKLKVKVPPQAAQQPGGIR
ncbi:MAG: OmpH family outer membrane protein [Chitinophagaceae bacterium]